MLLVQCSSQVDWFVFQVDYVLWSTKNSLLVIIGSLSFPCCLVRYNWWKSWNRMCTILNCDCLSHVLLDLSSLFTVRKDLLGHIMKKQYCLQKCQCLRKCHFLQTSYSHKRSVSVCVVVVCCRHCTAIERSVCVLVCCRRPTAVKRSVSVCVRVVCCRHPTAMYSHSFCSSCTPWAGRWMSASMQAGRGTCPPPGKSASLMNVTVTSPLEHESPSSACGFHPSPWPKLGLVQFSSSLL